MNAVRFIFMIIAIATGGVFGAVGLVISLDILIDLYCRKRHKR